MKMKIIVAAVAIILVSANTWALDDTPANRSREADRYFTKNPLHERLLQYTIDDFAQALPLGLRKKFKSLMNSNIDIPTLEKAMKDGMIKHFTADELKALTDSEASSVGESLTKKFEAYILEIMPAINTEMGEALVKASPKIKESILNDGRLGIRVINLYSAIARNDAKTEYEMQTPVIRRNWTFEGWKKDAGLDKEQQHSTQKIVQVELEKTCVCMPWTYENGPQAFRCSILLRVTTEDSEGHRKPNRLLEMWESVDGEWYHGYTDHHEWEDCPQ